MMSKASICYSPAVTTKKAALEVFHWEASAVQYWCINWQQRNEELPLRCCLAPYTMAASEYYKARHCTCWPRQTHLPIGSPPCADAKLRRSGAVALRVLALRTGANLTAERASIITYSCNDHEQKRSL
eukprot:21512-Heterococcus_DN1.PRE.3